MTKEPFDKENSMSRRKPGTFFIRTLRERPQQHFRDLQGCSSYHRPGVLGPWVGGAGGRIVLGKVPTVSVEPQR